MDIANLISAVSILGFVGATLGLFVFRRKYKRLFAQSGFEEGELSQKVYEAEVLRSVSGQVGYSLDAGKIIEIVSASLDKLLPYSAISYLVDSGVAGKKMEFWSKAKEPIGTRYVEDIKSKMLLAFSVMSQKELIGTDVTNGVSGGQIDSRLEQMPLSFFNLPIVISGKLVGIINISSVKSNLYNEKNMEVLYRLVLQVTETASRIQDIIKNERGKLSQAVESLMDGVLMVDSEMKLVLTNNSLEKMLNLSNFPTMLDVLNSLDGHLDLRTMLETAFGGTGKLEKREIEISGRALEVMATRVVNHKNSHTLGVVVAFYDVTTAKSLQRIRSEFMALMVHELRAPLTTIKSTVEYIDEEGMDSFKKEEIEHHLQVIETTSKAMLELVNDLLDVAKIDAGKFDVINEPGDLASSVNSELESFKALADEKHLVLTAEIDDDLPKAKFDKVRIKQVLNNLLSNAIKFTDSGGIKVKVHKEVVNGQGVDILVSVVDTGSGIEPDEASKLFSKFTQLKNGRTHASGIKGTGLGLYITKGIVEAMGGKIWVDSAGMGLGSTFNFTVPLARPDDQIITDESEHDIVFSTKRVARA